MFAKSAEQVVKYLNANTPLADWSVSRVTNGEQIHLHVHHDQVLSTGDRIAWEQSFCSRMSGGANHIVRDAKQDSSYSDLSASDDVRAYAGFTISDDRGELFGVLCGVRPDPLRPDEVVDEQLVLLFSELLSSQLQLSRVIDRERRELELSEAMAHTDALTGVLNRRGWERIVAEAQERVDGFGDPVAVAVIDLNGLKQINDSEGHSAGDALIRRAGEALERVCTAADHVARYGGDEFMVLSNGVVPSEAAAQFEQFANALERAGVSASLGYSAAQPGLVTLEQAIAEADQMMYARKRAR